MTDAYFWLFLGWVAGLCTCYLVGQWLRWRGNITFTDDAEERIRELKPMSDDWRPDWPVRRVK